jgi:RecJ-like exonuclease
MTNIVHTDKCKRERERHRDWVDKWPNYCQNCGGRGSVQWNESVPYGMGNVAMPMGEGCEACIWSPDHTICPRCAGDLSATVTDDSFQDGSEHIICPHCGWDSENPDMLPDNECYCWEDDQ